MRLSEEQRAATAIGENLVVNAGAGSGKTTVLIARYLRLLQEGGLTPKQIVAITFTRKAAREMRERIDETLMDMAKDKPQIRGLQEQLITAPIGTIHSFYARILRCFPVEAGVSPGFRVLEELESDHLLNKAVAISLQQAESQRCQALALLVEIFGAQALEKDGKISHQTGLFYKELRNRGISVAEAKLSREYEELPPWRECQESFAQLVAGEGELASALGEKDRIEMAQNRQILVAIGEDIASHPSPERLMAIYPALLGGTALKGGSVKAHKDFIASGIRGLNVLLSRGLAFPLGKAFLVMVRRLDRVFSALKRAAGGLDYADLQFAIAKLLQQPKVAEALSQEYQTFLVDEYQDTDRLQNEIILELAQKGGEIPPGRLFIVGDEKQSIYRFRGSEVEVFRASRKRLVAINPRAEKRITHNFRSRRPIIDLVNLLFAWLMDSPGEYIPLSAQRDGEGPAAELFVCTREPGASAAGEAAAMAARIREMVVNEELIVGDYSAPQPVTYRDIAILIRSRTHLKEYEHHLRLEGIPYTVIGGIGFYEQQEVQDVLNMLRVLSNRWDEISLVAVLRSPLFGLNDDSLYTLARSREKLGGYLLDQEVDLGGKQQQRLEQARFALGQLNHAWGRMGLPQLLELALELTKYKEAVLTGYAGLQRYANLEKLLDLAETYSATNIDGDFLTWVEQAAIQDGEEAIIDSEGSDSVRIMTIHASKGLQFPVVFLPLVNTGLRFEPGSLLVDGDGGLAFAFPWQCPVWKKIEKQERRLQAEEYKRLFYVAVTRARDRLVFMTQPIKNEELSFNYWLSKFAEGAPEHFILKQGKPRSGVVQFPQPLPAPGAPQPRPEKMWPGLVRVGRRRRAIRYFSASQFLLWKRDPEEFERQYLSRLAHGDYLDSWQNPADWDHEPGGIRFGSLLHRALETPFQKADLPTQLRALVAAYFPQADRDQREQVYFTARTLLEGYAKDPGPPGQFIASKSEQSFYYRIDSSLFFGSIDRLYLATDHVALIDFKSNHIPREGSQVLMETYRPQLRFYALATKEIYQQPVRAYLQLLRLPPGQQTIEVDLSEEEDFKGQLREFIDYCQQA